jgi:energy-converting hydrogenase Eha subunit B
VRPTADLVVLILTAVVAVVVIATTFAILFIRLTHPEQDVVPAADAIGRIVAVIVALLAGFIAGRRSNGYH